MCVHQMESDDEEVHHEDQAAAAPEAPEPPPPPAPVQDFVAELFPINKPPAKRSRGRGSGGGSGGASGSGRGAVAAKRRAIAGSSSSGGKKTSGPAPMVSTDVNVTDCSVRTAKSAHSTCEKPVPPKPHELLDSREVPDADELYSEHERALTQFLKLHPMLRCALSRAEPNRAGPPRADPHISPPARAAPRAASTPRPRRRSPRRRRSWTRTRCRPRSSRW